VRKAYLFEHILAKKANFRLKKPIFKVKRAIALNVSTRTKFKSIRL